MAKERIIPCEIMVCKGVPAPAGPTLPYAVNCIVDIDPRYDVTTSDVDGTLYVDNVTDQQGGFLYRQIFQNQKFTYNSSDSDVGGLPTFESDGGSIKAVTLPVKQTPNHTIAILYKAVPTVYSVGSYDRGLVQTGINTSQQSLYERYMEILLHYDRPGHALDGDNFCIGNLAGSTTNDINVWTSAGHILDDTHFYTVNKVGDLGSKELINRRYPTNGLYVGIVGRIVPGGTSKPFYGKIARVLQWDFAMTSEQFLEVVTYFNLLYGV